MRHDPPHEVQPQYTPDQCRICWLETFDPRYKGRAPVDTHSASSLECLHRGLVPIGSVSCGCASGAATPVFSCPRRGCCSVDLHADKQSVAVRGIGDTSVAACLACDARWTSTQLDNPPVPEVADFPRPQIEPVKRVRIDEANWPAAHMHFQLAVLPHRGRLFSANRMNWGGARVVLSEMDGEYRVLSSKIAKLPQTLHNRAGSEDPRLLEWRGALWVQWCAWSGYWRSRAATTQMLSRVNVDDLTIGETLQLSWSSRRTAEKNWSMFRWDDGYRDRLFALYQLSPTQVLLEVDSAGVCRQVSTCASPLPSQLGLVRGGASPVRHGGELWCVGHAVYRDRGRQWYAATLHTLLDRPPFTPRRVLPFPLIDPRVDASAVKGQGNSAVAFPCGAFVDSGRWRLVVSTGWRDKFAEVWEFDLKAVESALEWLPGAIATPPPLPAQAVEYTAAMARWLAAGRPERSDADTARIAATCQSGQCGRWLGDRCGECGCPVSADGQALANKARMATEKCPLGFWV